MNPRPFFFVFQKYSSAGWQKSVRVKSELKRMEKILLNTGVESKCQHFFSKQRYLLFMGVQQASKTEWSLRFNTASGLSSVCLLQIKVLLLRSIPSSVLVTFLTLICFWGSFALILRTKTMVSNRLFRVFINLERVSLGCARASVKRAFVKAQSGWRIRYNTLSVV